jgi:hypothetical protein
MVILMCPTCIIATNMNSRDILLILTCGLLVRFPFPNLLLLQLVSDRRYFGATACTMTGRSLHRVFFMHSV